uniref:Uncharacterized protein n=1 Tax=Oryza punctata TaxID=4537 RepID=A0A0E0LVF8_ORYPU
MSVFRTSCSCLLVKTLSPEPKITLLTLLLLHHTVARSPSRNLWYPDCSASPSPTGGTLDELVAVLGSSPLDDLSASASYMATTALADRPTSGGPRVAFASGVWCDAALPLKHAYSDAVIGRYKAEATTVNFKNMVSIYHY